MIKKVRSLIFFLLFVIFLSVNVSAGNFIDININFNGMNFYQSANGNSCGYQSGLLINNSENTSGVLRYCLRQNGCPASILKNSTITNDGSLKSANFNQQKSTCGTQQNTPIKLEEFCLDDQCYITNDTIVSFDLWCYSTTWTTTNDNVFGLYNAKSGESSSLELLDYGFKAAIKDSDSNVCELPEFTGLACINSWRHYEFSMEDMVNGDADCDFNTSKAIDSFIIAMGSSVAAGSADMYIDNITIKHLFNGTNDLPDFNVTTNNSYLCIEMNETFPQSIPINIDVSDTEGDQIYYGYSKQSINTTYFNDFNNYDLFQVHPDRTYLNNNFIAPCGFYELDSLLLNKHKLVDSFDSVGDRSFLLTINGFCINESKEVIQVFPSTAKALVYESEILSFDDEDFLNITFVDELLDQEIYDYRILLNRTGNNNQLRILLSNTSIINVLNFTSTENYFRLKISNGYSTPADITFKVTYSSNGLAITDTVTNTITLPITETEYKGVAYETIPDKMVYLGYTDYTLISYSVLFTTSKPNNVTFNREGYKHVYFYVSDDIHQPSEYVIKDLWFNVEQKRYCYNSIEDDITDIVIGNPLNHFLNYLDLKDKFVKMLYWTWLFLTIWFTVLIFKASHSIKIPLASFLGSAICFAFSYVIRTPTGMISFLIIGVISIIFTVIQQ